MFDCKVFLHMFETSSSSSSSTELEEDCFIQQTLVISHTGSNSTSRNSNYYILFVWWKGVFFFFFITSIFPSHITIHLICGSRNSSKWSELPLLSDPPSRHCFSRWPLLIHFWVKEFPEKTSFALFKGSMISKHSTKMGSNYNSSSQFFRS